MMRMQRRAPFRGFTLMEVLVALLLLSLLMAGAWGGIHTAVKAIHSGDEAIDQINRLRVTQQFLRRQLSHVLPLAFGRDESTGENFVFQGNARRMRFVAPMPGYLSRGGAYVQTLTLSQGSKGIELTFAHQMLNGFSLEDLQDNGVEPMLLIDGIADARFQYRGLADDGTLEDWSDEWEEATQTPVMVRIDMVMTPQSGLHWPTMTIPLMMDVSSLPRRARSQARQGMFQQGQPVPRQPDAETGEG